MPKINDKTTRRNRREAAEKRQAQYDALSIQQKIVRASERRGESQKEITSLGVQAGIYPATIEEEREAWKNLTSA